MAQPPYQPRPNGPRFQLNPEAIPGIKGSISQFARFTAPSNAQSFEAARTGPVLPSPSSSNTNATAVSQTIANPGSVDGSVAAWKVTNPIKPLPSQPIDATTFKDLQFITLDGLLTNPRDIYLEVSGVKIWQIYENAADRCIKFIKEECVHRRVFLIASGGLGKEVVPVIHDLPQVYAIYIYCISTAFHSQWAKTYNKIRVVTDQDTNDLIPRFAVDVAQANVDWADGLLAIGKRNEAKEKYEQVLKRLDHYARQHDPAMLEEIKAKLAKCS